MRLFRRHDEEPAPAPAPDPEPEPKPKQRFYMSPPMRCPNCGRVFWVDVPVGERVGPRDVTCPNCEVAWHIQEKVNA